MLDGFWTLASMSVNFNAGAGLRFWLLLEAHATPRTTTSKAATCARRHQSGEFGFVQGPVADVGMPAPPGSGAQRITRVLNAVNSASGWSSSDPSGCRGTLHRPYGPMQTM